MQIHRTNSYTLTQLSCAACVESIGFLSSFVPLLPYATVDEFHHASSFHTALVRHWYLRTTVHLLG